MSCDSEREPFTHTMKRLSHDLLLLISQRLDVFEAIMLTSVSRTIRQALIIAVNKRPELLGKRVWDLFLSKALAYFRERFPAQTFQCKHLVCLDILQARHFSYAITSPEDKIFMLNVAVMVHHEPIHCLCGTFWCAKLDCHYDFFFDIRNEEQGNMFYFNFGGNCDALEADYVEGGPWKVFKEICCAE